MSPDGLATRVKREEEQALGGRVQWQLALMAMPGKPAGGQGGGGGNRPGIQHFG